MPNNIKVVKLQTIDNLSKQAMQSDRKRKNLNLHDDLADPCQRLFNAVEPETYIRPHRHSNPPKPECFLGIRGEMALLLFNDDGSVKDVILFGKRSDVVAIEVPPGIWHSVVSLTSTSVFFETKPGPYQQLTDKDFAPWAPIESSTEAVKYQNQLLNLANSWHKKQLNNVDINA